MTVVEGGEVPADPAEADCPDCGRRGAPVARRTVAGSTRAPLPATQRLYVCLTPGCPVLHYGDRGARIGVGEAQQPPWLKLGAGTVCFCFGHDATEVTGPDGGAVFARVKRRVKSRECACDLRNPTGRCCLGDLARILAASQSPAPLLPP